MKLVWPINKLKFSMTEENTCTSKVVNYLPKSALILTSLSKLTSPAETCCPFYNP